jgi:hypothetical protein
LSLVFEYRPTLNISRANFSLNVKSLAMGGAWHDLKTLTVGR